MTESNLKDKRVCVTGAGRGLSGLGELLNSN